MAFMLLSDNEILSLVKAKKLGISPFNRRFLGPASYDLAVSDEWWVLKSSVKSIELSSTKLSKRPWQSYYIKKKSKRLVLEPNAFILGVTKERIKLPSYLAARVEGRSGYARLGLSTHPGVTLVQPGTDGRVLLEIKNVHNVPLTLKAGERIAQISFILLSSEASELYDNRMAIK